MTVVVVPKTHLVKRWGEDCSNIGNPERSDVELISYCQWSLNRYMLRSYMPNCPGGCIGKIDSSFTNNLLGFIIWKHMHGIVWVKTTSLNIEKNLIDVDDF